MTSKKASYKLKHEEIIKKENESCFLPNKEKINYNSFILLEFFSLEEFQNLFDGLDCLYEDTHPFEKDKADYKNILENSKSRFFSRKSQKLPTIGDLKFKGKSLSIWSFHKLPKNVEFLTFRIYTITPSVAVLQIHVHLDKNHKESKEKIVKDKGTYEITYYPQQIKSNEIRNLKNKVKRDIVDFLSNYFKGSFFKLVDKDVNVVPSIDIYSLKKIPLKSTEKTVEWFSKNTDFFSCLDTLPPSSTFSYNGFMFSVNERNESRFVNCSIFANQESFGGNIYPDIDSEIKGYLDSINFDLFVVYRWLEVQEILVGELNSMISEENQKSNFMHLKKIIESRRKMSNKIFQFERFVVEFDNYSPFPDKPKFIPLKGNGDLFENLKTNIDEKMCIIKNMIRLFNEHSKQLLDLKNIEYNRNIQNLLLILAILALLISIIQFFGLKYSDIFQLFEKIKGII